MTQGRVLEHSMAKLDEDCLKLPRSTIADPADLGVIEDISASEFDGLFDFVDNKTVRCRAKGSTVSHNMAVSVLDDLECEDGPSSELIGDGSFPVYRENTEKVAIKELLDAAKLFVRQLHMTRKQGPLRCAEQCQKLLELLFVDVHCV